MPRSTPPERSPSPFLLRWTQTGRWRWRRRFLFGPVLEVELERDEWRPVVSGHTPINWQKVTRWTRGDAFHNYPAAGRVEP